MTQPKLGAAHCSKHEGKQALQRNAVSYLCYEDRPHGIYLVVCQHILRLNPCQRSFCISKWCHVDSAEKLARRGGSTLTRGHAVCVKDARDVYEQI